MMTGVRHNYFLERMAAQLRWPTPIVGVALPHF